MSAAPPPPQPLATRSATACVRCRRQKTKCLHDDNGQPCRGCLKAQQQCIFPGKVPRAPRAPVIAGLPPLTNTTISQTQPPPPPTHRHASSPDRSDLASQLELHPSHIQDCERSLALWPFPCFHRPGFMRQLREGHLPQTLNYAILSSGARASPGLIHHFGSPGGASEFFAEKAQANILNSMDCPSIPDVQSLCLLAMHHWGSGRGTRAFVYLGTAARMAQMFLPQATSHDEDFIAAETARRAIWTCFIMDQFLSCGTGRPPAIRAEDVQIQLPCSEDDYHFGSSVKTPGLNGGIPGHTQPERPKADVGEFGHMIRVAVLWRQAISWVMDPPEDEQDDAQYLHTLADLRHWAGSLPSRQQDTPGKIDLHIQVGNGYSFAFTHSVYYCASIFLARKQLHRMGRRTGGRDTDADVNTIINTITHAAHRVTALITTLDANASFVGDASAPPAYPVVVLLAAYTSASTIANMALQNVLMQDSHRHSSDTTAPNGADTAAHDLPERIILPTLDILRKSAPVWPLAERWYWELSRLSTKLDARSGKAPRTAERHDSHHPPLSGSGSPQAPAAAVNGHQTAYQHGGQPNGAESRLPSPFMAASSSLGAPPASQSTDVSPSEADGAEGDSAAFDEHLKGVADLATFLGTNGFRY